MVNVLIDRRNRSSMTGKSIIIN